MTGVLTGLRIAVTGASGFCGSVVAESAAAAGASVVCLGRRAGPVGLHVPWDATLSTPDLAGADVIVHLAAAVGDSGSLRHFRQVNVDAAVRVLDAAGSRPVVWVSSASVYDPRVDRHWVREDHPTGGQLTAYGQTKALGERLALDAGAVVLRPRAVYGPGDPYLLPRILGAVRRGRLLLPGPDVRLSLTAVENLADACLLALRWPPGAYNIVDASPYERDASMRAVLSSYGVPAVLTHVPVPLAMLAARLRLRSLTPYAVDQVAHSVVLDWSKAGALGYQPRRCLDDFLQQVRALA